MVSVTFFIKGGFLPILLRLHVQLCCAPYEYTKIQLVSYVEGNASCRSVLKHFVRALIKYGNTQVPVSTPEQLRKDGFKTQTIAVESFSG